VPTEDDANILNKGEINEVFPDGSGMQWGELAPYPRSPTYDDQFRLLRIRSQRAIRTGKLRFIQQFARTPEDAIKNWVAALSALQIEPVNRAALPDYEVGTPPPYIGPGPGFNMVIPSYTGFDSKYLWLKELNSRPAIDIDESWRRLALGRLGRVMKVVRRASAENAIPLATDPINQNICLALGAQAFGDIPTPSKLANAAISMDAVDPIALESAVESMTWDEVFRVRREILPSVARLRGLLISSVRAASKPDNTDFESYMNALQEIKDGYRSTQDEVREAWRKIGIGTGTAAATATVTSGLSALAVGASWANVVTAVAISTVANAIGVAAPNVQNIMKAGKAQKASPLFAFDRIISLGESELKKQVSI